MQSCLRLWEVNIPLGAALYKWWGYLHIKVDVAMVLREAARRSSFLLLQYMLFVLR